MNAFTSPIYKDAYASTYEGPTVLEGYMKKKRNKDKQLISEKTSDKYFRLSFEDRKLCYKPNKTQRDWRRELPFESFLKFFATLDKEDKQLCDFPYGVQIMTKDNKKYVFFCKEEEEHYKWVRMLGFIIHKKDIGSFDNYKKKFSQAVQSVKKDNLNKPVLIRSTSIMRPYDNGIIYADQKDNSFINNNEIEINVNEQENVVQINFRKSKVGNSILGPLMKENTPDNKNNRLADISNILPKSSPHEFRQPTYNEVQIKYKVGENKDSFRDLSNNLQDKKNFNNFNNLYTIPEYEDQPKKVKESDMDFDQFLENIGNDKRLTSTLNPYKNKKDLNETLEIGKLLNIMDPKENNFGQSGVNLNRTNNNMNNSQSKSPIKVTSNNNENFNKYRYPNKGTTQNNLNKNATQPQQGLSIKDLLSEGSNMHIKKDLYGEKIQIENLHCGIDDMSEVNIDKKNSWIGHLPIKSINKIGFKEEEEKNIVKNFPFRKKKNQTENVIGKVQVKSGDKLLDVDRSIIGGEDDNSWVLNFRIKEQR
jgi:hypothetical protein